MACFRKLVCDCLCSAGLRGPNYFPCNLLYKHSNRPWKSGQVWQHQNEIVSSVFAWVLCWPWARRRCDPRRLSGVFLTVHTNLSLSYVNWNSTTLLTSSGQYVKLLPTIASLKDIFSGVVLSTWATVTFFFLTMLYKVGYFRIRGLFPSHKSSQNLVWSPSCTEIYPVPENRF